MNLLIDIGNTRTKYVYETSSGLSKIEFVENGELDTEAKFDNWFKAIISNVQQIVLANVNQTELTERFEHLCHKHRIGFKHIRTQKKRFNVEIAYQNESQLGVDRWLAILGAQDCFPDQNLIIVDSGTATTVDCLNKNGKHIGGWILPGIDLMRESLALNTEKVAVGESSVASLEFGANTVECVNYALWSATVGLIEQGIKVCEREETAVDKIVLTGGNACKLIPILQKNTEFIPELVFHGLKRFID